MFLPEPLSSDSIWILRIISCEHYADINRRKNSVPCVGGCPICTYLCEMEKKYPDFQGSWKLRSREITIVYAWIFSSSEDNKFVKTGAPVLLMGNHKLGRELNDHIADMDEEDFARMLDPLTEHALWELKSGNNGKDFSLAPSFKTGTMDLLPDALYPLSQCIHLEGEVPSAEEVSKFIEVIESTYEAYVKKADCAIAKVTDGGALVHGLGGN